MGTVILFSRPLRRDWIILIKRRYRYLLEHGLKMDGRPDPDTTATAGGSYETFFTETGNGKYVPRSIFVDLDPSVGLRSEITAA